MNKFFSVISVFICCLLLFACNSNSGSVVMSEPTYTSETGITPSGETSFTSSGEIITPAFETSKPSERPTDEPVKTIDNTASPAPTLTPTPTGSPDITPVITETSETPTPRPGYMENYGEWMDWRVSHPDEYNEWLSMDIPEKTAATSVKPIDFPEDPITELNERYIDAGLDSSFPYEKYGSSYRIQYEYISTPLSLPRICFIIEQFGITKEELLEYTRWQSWSDQFKYASLSKEDIDVLYSGDKDLIRDHFRLGDKYTYLNDDLLFTRFELEYLVDPFEIGRIFTPDSFADFRGYAIGQGLNKWREEQLAGSWEKYERIKQRDAGELTMEAAEEMIGDFMYLYKNLRYSPDDVAGETLADHGVKESTAKDQRVFKNHEYIAQVQFSFLSFDIVGCYNYMLRGQIFNLYDWFDDFQYAISMDPKFYQGEIETFDDDYTLADHINIVYTDNEDAYVELTARKRDGSGEAVYTVNFKKSYERWRISSGTMLDLIAPVE